MAVTDIPMIEVMTVEGPADPADTTQADLQSTGHQAQAMAEGVSASVQTIEILGKEFLLAEKIGLMPLLKFAHLAKQGMDTDRMNESEMMDAMAAVYSMIMEVVHPDDHSAFEDHATAVHADMEDLMGGVGKAIELMTARPTQQRSGSSDSPSATGPSLTDARLRTAAMGLVPVDQALTG